MVVKRNCVIVASYQPLFIAIIEKKKGPGGAALQGADWLKSDYAVWKELGIRDGDSFRAWINRIFVWFELIREIAVGGKHFARDGQNFESFRVAALPFMLDHPDAGLGMGAWDGPIRYVSGSLPVGPEGKGYLMLDLGEGAGECRWMFAADLIEAVVGFWRDFFRKYRPSPDLPVSKHHVD
jgi:hypothetical protein